MLAASFPKRVMFRNSDKFTFSSAVTQSRKAPISFLLSVRLSACISTAPTGWTYVTFDVTGFYQNPSRNSQYGKNTARMSDR
jgi:hypothetical protein